MWIGTYPHAVAAPGYIGLRVRMSLYYRTRLADRTIFPSSNESCGRSLTTRAGPFSGRGRFSLGAQLESNRRIAPLEEEGVPIHNGLHQHVYNLHQVSHGPGAEDGPLRECDGCFPAEDCVYWASGHSGCNTLWPPRGLLASALQPS